MNSKAILGVFLIVTALLTGFASLPPISATFVSLAGRWKNDDVNTHDWAELLITYYNPGGDYVLQLWGTCGSTECSSVNVAQLYVGNSIGQATMVGSFATRQFTLTLESANALTMVTHTHYTDNSGRTDYTISDNFYRVPT